MKNVYTSWNLDLLADKLIEKIVENWKTPFNSPAVVFTDPKTEQWFKLHWLKTRSAGNSILMNLKTLRIQQFLFDLVTPHSAIQSGEIDILSVELLRDLLITKLTEKNNGKYYFETLGSQEAVTYLTSEASESKINANHLYDFAQTIASLFLDYEDTRPDSLNEILAKSEWQPKLYKDVIGEAGVEIDGIKYLTLYKLVKLNKKINGGELSFNWPKDRPVFIFGFSGIGQIYRNILEDFSKTNSLEVFLQLSDNITKAENELLDKWGKYGFDQLDLWKKNLLPQNDIILKAEYKTDTLLHRIQKSIAENNRFSSEPYDSKDTSLTLTAAPNCIREIEALHSKICSLLSNTSGDTQLSDILVVAPCIQDYKTAIEQVFDQNVQYSEQSAFPYLPYTIADYSGERSLTAEALTVLFGILKKGYLCRSDVFAILHNYLVQTVRDISNDEISNWSDWTEDLNIYRDRPALEDWQKAKNRLLLSRLTSDLTENNGGKFLPYETITTNDNDSLYKFIKVIDDLKEWTKYSEQETLVSDDIDRIRQMLESWLLTGDNTPDDLFNESLVFQNVIEEIERQQLTAKPYVFTDCFENALFDRSHAVTLHSGSIFTRGITFANFESNRVLSAKYIFFLGLDSKTFPGIDSSNELDLRSGVENKETGDESIPEKNKNAFLCQLMAAQEGFFISYINKNLQKDEDFYKSSVLSDLFQLIYEHGPKEQENSKYEIKIKIDEDRPWSKLYTQREFRNKHNYLSLTGNNDPFNWKTRITQASVHYQPDRVKINQIKNFLQEPFVYMVNQKLTGNFDDDDEKEQFEFEPLFLDNLLNSKIRKTYVQSMLDPDTPDFDEASLSAELRNQNILPDSYFGTTALNNVMTEADLLLSKIRDEQLDQIAYTFNEDKMLLMKTLQGTTDKEWYIYGNRAWYNKDYASQGEIQTLELSNSQSVLSGYVTSLVLLAALPEEVRNEFPVTLHAVSQKKGVVSFNYRATPETARITLCKIYNAMYIEGFCNSVPEKILREDYGKSKENQISFEEFMEGLSGYNGRGEWQYFSKQDLFDLNTDLYNPENFSEDWMDAKEHQAKLILYILQNPNIDKEAGN